MFYESPHYPKALKEKNWQMFAAIAVWWNLAQIVSGGKNWFVDFLTSNFQNPARRGSRDGEFGLSVLDSHFPLLCAKSVDTYIMHNFAVCRHFFWTEDLLVVPACNNMWTKRQDYSDTPIRIVCAFSVLQSLLSVSKNTQILQLVCKSIIHSVCQVWMFSTVLLELWP